MRGARVCYAGLGQTDRVAVRPFVGDLLVVSSRRAKDGRAVVGVAVLAAGVVGAGAGRLMGFGFLVVASAAAVGAFVRGFGAGSVRVAVGRERLLPVGAQIAGVCCVGVDGVAAWRGRFRPG